MSIDNSAGAEIARLTNTTAGRGYINVNNSGGAERARMFVGANGGEVSVNNAAGTKLAEISINTSTQFGQDPILSLLPWKAVLRRCPLSGRT